MEVKCRICNSSFEKKRYNQVFCSKSCKYKNDNSKYQPEYKLKSTPITERDFLVDEIWKDIQGYEGLYQASTKGRIRSLDRVVRMGEKNLRCTGRIFVGKINRFGYMSINISVNNSKKHYTIHRLVAQTFIPNPENKPQVNHINGIKTDNRVENLEWCTSKENSIHAWKNGLMTKCSGKNSYLYGIHPDKSPNAKKVKCTESNKEWGSITSAANELGLKPNMLGRMLRGASKNATTLVYVEELNRKI